MVAITNVIAWRIMLMCLLGREASADTDPRILFSDDELGFLELYAKEYRQQLPNTLKNAVNLVALIGGYRDRIHDPEPRSKIIWRGNERLYAGSMTFKMMQNQNFYPNIIRCQAGLCVQGRTSFYISFYINLYINICPLTLAFLLQL